MADRARRLEDALTLPVEDRARVAHELLRSLEPDEGDVTAAWTDEIHRRIDEVEAGTAELHDLEGARGDRPKPKAAKGSPIEWTVQVSGTSRPPPVELSGRGTVAIPGSGWRCTYSLSFDRSVAPHVSEFLMVECTYGDAVVRVPSVCSYEEDSEPDWRARSGNQTVLVVGRQGQPSPLPGVEFRCRDTR